MTSLPKKEIDYVDDLLGTPLSLYKRLTYFLDEEDDETIEKNTPDEVGSTGITIFYHSFSHCF